MHLILRFCFTSGLSLVAAVSLCGTASLNGQVVQLPSVHSFGMSGGAIVPDMGDAGLGGIRTGRSTTTTSGLGPMPMRTSSGARGASSASISAMIIDLDAMDQALLNQARTASATRSLGSNAAAPAGGSAPGNSSNSGRAGLPSGFQAGAYGKAIVNTSAPNRYAQHSASREFKTPNDWQLALVQGQVGALDGPRTDARDRDNAVRHYMNRAAEAQAVGRIAAARVYFQMAYDTMTEQQRGHFDQLVADRKLTDKERKAAADQAAAAAPAPPAQPPAAAPANEAANSASPFDMPASSDSATANPF